MMQCRVLMQVLCLALVAVVLPLCDCAQYVGMNGGRWSTPSSSFRVSGSDTALPVNFQFSLGDNVIIPANVSMLLDSSPAASLGYISILAGGSLHVDNGAGASASPILLSLETLLVAGYLNMGTAAQPLARTFNLEFVTRSVPPSRAVDTGIDHTFEHNTATDSYDYGKKMIAVIGRGEWSAHAVGRTPRWSHLIDHVKIGDKQLMMEGSIATNWQVGDEIMITSTDYDVSQSERLKLIAVEFVTASQSSTGTAYSLLTLNATLKYNHYGRVWKHYGWDVDMRAEIANLDSNVRVYGEMVHSLVPDPTSPNEAHYIGLGYADVLQFGAHALFVGSSIVRLEGLTFQHMGQGGRLAHYSIHWHKRGDAPGQYIKRCAVIDNFSKAITIHSTNRVLIQDNFVYKTYGHSIYIEDGGEELNEFIRNLVVWSIAYGAEKKEVGVYKYPDPQCTDVVPGLLLQFEDAQPSGFWIVNTNNTFIGNVAIGHDWGFWVRVSYMFNEPPYLHGIYNGKCPTGPIAFLCCQPPVEEEAAYFPHNAPNGGNKAKNGLIFINNVAHGNRQAGWWIKEDWVPAVKLGQTVDNFNFTHFIVDGFLTYKNPHGFENYGHGNQKMNAIIAVDNFRGLSLDHNRIGNMPVIFENSLIVGESDNFGTPSASKHVVSCSSIYPGVTRTYYYTNGGGSGIDPSGGQMVYNNMLFSNWLQPNCTSLSSNTTQYFNYGNYYGSWHTPEDEQGAFERRYSNLYFNQARLNNIPTTASQAGMNGVMNDTSNPRYNGGYLDVTGSFPCSQPNAQWLYNTAGIAGNDCEYRSNLNTYVCPPQANGDKNHYLWTPQERFGWGYPAALGSFTARWECGKTYAMGFNGLMGRSDRLIEVTPTIQPYATKADGFQTGIVIPAIRWGPAGEIGLRLQGRWTAKLFRMNWYDVTESTPIEWIHFSCTNEITNVRFKLTAYYEHEYLGPSPNQFKYDFTPGTYMTFTRNSSAPCTTSAVTTAPWEDELLHPPTTNHATYCSTPMATSSTKNVDTCKPNVPANHGTGMWPRPEPALAYPNYPPINVQDGFDYTRPASSSTGTQSSTGSVSSTSTSSTSTSTSSTSSSPSTVTSSTSTDSTISSVSSSSGVSFSSSSTGGDSQEISSATVVIGTCVSTLPFILILLLGLLF